MIDYLASIPERLAHDAYETDEEESHIEVHQEEATISVEYAACLECGTCLAVAPPGTLTWHYPRGGMGVVFREG